MRKKENEIILMPFSLLAGSLAGLIYILTLPLYLFFFIAGGVGKGAFRLVKTLFSRTLHPPI